MIEELPPMPKGDTSGLSAGQIAILRAGQILLVRKCYLYGCRILTRSAKLQRKLLSIPRQLQLVLERYCYQYLFGQSCRALKNAINFYILVEVAEANTVFMRHISHTIWLGMICAVRFRPVFNRAIKFLSFVRSGKNRRCACQKICQTDCRNYDDTGVDFSFIVAVRSVAVCPIIHFFLS